MHPDAMLRSSFVFLDRVSLAGERKLWQRGMGNWDAFRNAERIPGFSKERKAFSDRQIERMEQALQARDLSYLSAALPKSEHWRLFPLLKGNALYVDIETAERYGDITVLGAFDGTDHYSFVKGGNLEGYLVKRLFSQYKLFVTFNGSSFDLPIIERYFRGVLPVGYAHVDLRHSCSRLGLVGGLKTIELQLGIRRQDDVEGMDGAHAAILWYEYLLTREEELVELLLAYNEADCRNLEPLAELVVERLWKRLRKPSLRPLLPLMA